MTFSKLGYVRFKPEIYDKKLSEAVEAIVSILGDGYYDDISIHFDSCGDKELWLEFSAEDIAYKKLIGELLTQEEYDALVENNADVILFY